MNGRMFVIRERIMHDFSTYANDTIISRSEALDLLDNEEYESYVVGQSVMVFERKDS